MRAVLQQWKKLDCLFGGVVFFEIFKSKRERIKAHLQIEKYLNDNKFEINPDDVLPLFRKKDTSNCGILNLRGELIKNLSLKIEVFLQELDLRNLKKPEKRVLSNLGKLMDVKYPVFFYE